MTPSNRPEQDAWFAEIAVLNTTPEGGYRVTDAIRLADASGLTRLSEGYYGYARYALTLLAATPDERQAREEEKAITIRAIVRDLDLVDLDMKWADAVEAATVYAIQLGYRMNPGTGGAYADWEVTESHAEIIMDLICNTDADGVYSGSHAVPVYTI